MPEPVLRDLSRMMVFANSLVGTGGATAFMSLFSILSAAHYDKLSTRNAVNQLIHPIFHGDQPIETSPLSRTLCAITTARAASTTRIARAALDEGIGGHADGVACGAAELLDCIRVSRWAPIKIGRWWPTNLVTPAGIRIRRAL